MDTDKKATWPPKVEARYASIYLHQEHGIKRSVQTLAKYRCAGGGPKFYPGSGKPLYALGDLDVWAKEILGDIVSSTSEYPAGRSAAA